MVMLQNVCENCVQILEKKNVRYHVKKVKETGIPVDKPKRDKPETVRTPENIVVYTLEQRWEVGLRSTYGRCRFLQKIMLSKTSVTPTSQRQLTL